MALAFELMQITSVVNGPAGLIHFGGFEWDGLITDHAIDGLAVHSFADFQAKA